MANPKYRFFTVLLGGKKAGSINNVSEELNSGDQAQIIQEGYGGHSDGVIMTKYSANEVTSVAGSSMTELLETKFLLKEDVDCTTYIGGKLHKVTCRITSLAFSAERSSGSCTGKIELEGGAPVLVGL